jgi:putative ABC transport system permease protein
MSDVPGQETRSLPLIPTLLLRLMLPREYRDQVLGDVREAYDRDVRDRGTAFARSQLWREALSVQSFRLRWETRGLRTASRTTTSKRIRPLHSFLGDIRYATRVLARARGYTAVAVITIALGVGANSAIFSVIDGVLLKPLSYHEPDRIVCVWPQLAFNKSLVDRFEQRTRSFSGLSATATETFSLTGEGEPEELIGAVVSVNHFTVMGSQPVLGRAFIAKEEMPGGGNVVLLSHRLWTRRFGSDPAIVGKSITLGGGGKESRIVIGVMPADYHPLESSWSVWVPMEVDPTDFPDYAGTARYHVIGRVAPGVTLEAANTEVHSLALEFHSDNTWIPEYLVQASGVVSVRDALVGDIRPRLLLLLAAVGLVLLVACTNVANLLLARGAGRQRELAVRVALGASRWRVMRQLLTETTVLGLLGGAVGFVGAAWTVSLVTGNMPVELPLVDAVGIDVRVLLFTLGITLLASLLFGLLPAVRATTNEVGSSLKEGTRHMTAVGSQRLRMTLVVTETALAVVLVIGAGLMVKSASLLQRVDPGFDHEQLLTLRASPPAIRYRESSDLRAYYAQVDAAVEAVPGVVGLGMVNYLPMTGATSGMLWDIQDEQRPEGTPMPRANASSVTPGYFRTMRIPLLQGREFDAADRADGEPVMIVNQSMARQVAPDGNPLGKRVGGFAGDTYFTVVGVVGDIRQYQLDVDAQPEMFFPYQQWSSSRMYLLVRTAGTSADMIDAVKRAVWSVDGDVPISRVRTMDEVVNRTMAESRFFTQLLTGFALLALALGAVGLYGVMAYTVARSTHEIGIKVALGAPVLAVSRAIVGRGLFLVSVGVLLGLGGAWAATRVLSSYLFGVSTTDTTVFLGVPAILIAVALLASYVPARRAMQVDPMVALRGD